METYLESHRLSTTNDFRNRAVMTKMCAVSSLPHHTYGFFKAFRIRPYPTSDLPLALRAVRWWIRIDTYKITGYTTHHRNTWPVSEDTPATVISSLHSTWKSHRFDGRTRPGSSIEALSEWMPKRKGKEFGGAIHFMSIKTTVTTKHQYTMKMYKPCFHRLHWTVQFSEAFRVRPYPRSECFLTHSVVRWRISTMPEFLQIIPSL